MQENSIESNETKVQIIQSNCLFNKKLNKNNAIDGTNIIYLAGASIVFHNIFQNTKRFINKISDAEVIGMSFFKSSQNIVALATKYPSKQLNGVNDNNSEQKRTLNIELYVLGQEGILIAQLSQNVEFIDMEFLDKKKIILLAKQNQENYFYFLQLGKKLKKQPVKMNNPKRFITQDRRICVIGQKGMQDIDFDMEDLCPELRFQNISIDDYVIIDNQFEIILCNNKLICFHDLEQIDELILRDEIDNNPAEVNHLVRVGRNLLVSHRNSITLSHFIIDHNNLKFLNNYTYKEKMKGGILGMQVSFDEMHLAMSVEVVEKDVVKIENFMFNLSILSSEKKFINPFIRSIPLGTQNSEIACLQGVIPFETYYLAGNTIVNYTYNDQVQKKFKFSLHEVPKQIAAHPLGYQFVCLFETQIKFYLKIENDIVEIWTEQLICSYAKYTTCGSLLLSCLQDNFYQLIVYDTNSFKRVKNIPNIYIKHPITRIQLAQHDSQGILYIGHDLSIYKLKNGEKFAEYREKKDKQEIVTMAYDANYRSLLASTTHKNLIFCKKVDDISWDFKFQKTINMKQEITYIEINIILQTVFMGTKSGKLLWAEYPLNLIQQQDGKYSIQYKQLKLHNLPITQIYLTNNIKYLFISFKQEGLIICKLRKILKYTTANNNNNTRYNEFDISNLNFLETSSKTSLEFGYEKLKSLLEKRKTVFNDLEEHKKQKQVERMQEINRLSIMNKKKELNHINEALGEIEKLKKEKHQYKEDLKKIEEETQKFRQQKRISYETSILKKYEKNIELKCKKQKVMKRCESEFETIEEKCQQNISEIDKQLKQKYQCFLQNYNQMKSNLVLYQKRLEIQKNEAQEILLQMFNNKKQKLNEEEVTENKKSNDYKALITKFKKECQRYHSRKYFLEGKKNFFEEQISFCRQQKGELIDIKQELQEELKQLELITNKKEKRLRKYFKQNEILTKYQMIHNNLVKNLDNEVEFIENEKQKTSKDIVTIQKQLSEVAQLNEVYEDKIGEYKKKIIKLKQEKYHNSQQTRYFIHIIQQMKQAIQKIKINLNEQNKANLFKQIYRNFFIKRKLENIIQSSQIVDPSKQQQEIEFKIFNSSNNKLKVIQNMKQHRQYLQKNMKLFEKHNQKTDEEMNLNYLKYQTQNYNLIAECNVRKQQTTKKKRILHELIDSVKQTQLYMNQLHKQNIDEGKLLKSSSVQKTVQSIPFIVYKQSKQQQQKSRLRILRKQQSQPTFWKVKKSTYQVRKMLQVQKIRPQSQNKIRNIKTAIIKNRNTDHTVHIESSEYNKDKEPSKLIRKPMTASGKRHEAPFGQYYNFQMVRNKSSSKPTTCTTHTHKPKTSVFC